jgi:hypothetical protein
MDFEDGAVHYKVFVSCLNGAPAEQDVRNAFIIPIAAINKYGNGLIDVLTKRKSPLQAIMEIEKEGA